MSPAPPPATKLPLGIRKGVRDNFENELPNWKEKLIAYTAAPSSFEIEADILQLFTYAKEGWQKQNFGDNLASFVTHFLSALQKYTNSGEDQDAVKSFGKAVGNYRITIEADSKVEYCGTDISDGTLRLIFHPDKFATNTFQLSYDHFLAQNIDSINTRLYPTYVPLVMVRAARNEIPKIERTRKWFHELFGKEIDINYDLRALYDTLMKNRDQIERLLYRDEGAICRALPGEVAHYLELAILKMKTLVFSEDELYRTEWLMAAPKGVIFEVVEHLQTGAPHNECIYQDGYFKLRTSAKSFGSYQGTIADGAVELL